MTKPEYGCPLYRPPRYPPPMCTSPAPACSAQRNPCNRRCIYRLANRSRSTKFYPNPFSVALFWPCSPPARPAITDFNRLPDEAIGFPAGFLQAGVPGMMGTLWSVNDLSTALVMIQFYTYHLKDGQAPAEALRNTQLWLRDVTNAELAELFVYLLEYEAQPSTPGMDYETAQATNREHLLRDPDERPFAQPYYWALFVFCGA